MGLVPLLSVSFVDIFWGFGVLTVGILHGANDLEIISKNYKGKYNRLYFKSILLYLAVVLLGAAFFFTLPGLALIIFVLFSSYHFVASKKAVSLILLPILIITSLISVFTWIYGLVYLQETSDINAIFYNEFFTILILADVLILLLSFQYTERYSQLIRNTGFVICTILIRLSFGVSGLTNVVLIISSIGFGLLILTIYNMEENPLQKKNVSE